MKKIRLPAVLVSVVLVSVIVGLIGFQLNAAEQVADPVPTYMDVPF